MLDSRPELFEDLSLAWECWSRLSACRPVGMTPSGIPPSEVREHLDLWGIRDPETRRDLYDLVALIDSHQVRIAKALGSGGPSDHH